MDSLLVNTSKEEVSIFETKPVKAIHEEIQNVYLSDSRPWIIGYSGGKDSTTVVQLIWNAITDLEPNKRNKKIYVISNDTLVETPIIVDHVRSTLDNINDLAKREKMPFEAVLNNPEIKDTFWVSIIGKGYPAPNQRFRWCTDRLKIKPANKFILEKVSKHGEVIVVLGVRKDESATRNQVLSLRKIKKSLLSTHSTLANAFVYTPIVDFSTNDVWRYLLTEDSPWGLDNSLLMDKYLKADDGECPTVIDKTTPSCGNSRFGCWTCTVVERDKSLEASIDNGEKWLQPLLDFRNKLSATQDPKVKHKYRQHRRMNGKIYWNSKDPTKLVRGPYYLDFCKELLEDLLKIQIEINESNPESGLILISEEELLEIRRIWIYERNDWEDSANRIYKKVTGDLLIKLDDDLGLFGEHEKSLLQEICEDKNLPYEMVAKLLESEKRSSGLFRRSNIMKDIESIVNMDWESESEAKNETIISSGRTK